jgi:cyclophilin family peptidyl-prolyl cis-trans isomerase
MGRRGHPYYDSMFYDTAGSQFFICVTDYPSLDGRYASFGKTISGLDIAIAISDTMANSFFISIKTLRP